MSTTLHTLLRDPTTIARRCREDDGLRDLVLTSLATVAIGGAIFGAVLGSFRGDLQVLYAAIKVPVALIVTLALCAPAFLGITAGMGASLSLRSVVALSLTAAARTALVLVALAPALWLAIDLGLPYHKAVLWSAAVYGLAGVAALSIMLRGLIGVRHRFLTAFGFILIFLAVDGQTSWVLRPYLLRPSEEGIPFLRAKEGSFTEELRWTARSATGTYDRPGPSWIDSRRLPRSR